MSYAIEVDGLSFAFGNGRPVLEDVNLRVDELDFASVIGPNGGGKTTLVKLFLGLHQPTRGSVRILGTTPEKARRQVGYMPQHATLDPSFPVRVLDVVLMGRLGTSRRLGSLSPADKTAALAALSQVGLEGLHRRPFSDLSGGERQRVLVARALASKPRLLLLDEPASGLDQRVEHDFFELLSDLNREITIVLVSHDLGFVSRYVRTVICVNRTVAVHPTSAVNGQVIADIYQSDVHMVRHDHSLEHPE
jgi:zinc transport system ATP-binding protein